MLNEKSVLFRKRGEVFDKIIEYSSIVNADKIFKNKKELLPEGGVNYFSIVLTALPANASLDDSLINDIKKEIVWYFNKILMRECQTTMIVYFEDKKTYILCKIDVFLNIEKEITDEEEFKIKDEFSKTIKYKIEHLSRISINENKPNKEPIESGTKNELEIWRTFNFDDRLLNDDNYLNNESSFSKFYGINSQIRMVLSPLQSAIQTVGKRMVHSVLFGPPACGKTSVLNKLETIIGRENILKLDATTTTKAGIEKLFLGTSIPPVVILEEAEKANEDWLRNWLSLLDERSEIRKVSHKETIIKNIDILFYCTVNDSDKFNDLLDGALASRCKNKIYFPRPSIETIEKILYRDIQENGGKNEWVPFALQLAKELGVDDPRIILSFLSGGDRLLSGLYQEDKKKCINTTLIT
jgi:hypothetical protein